LWAQTPEEVVRWNAHGPATAKAGARLQIDLQGVIQDEWHVYSISQMPGGPTRTVISLSEGQPFERDGSLTAPMPHTAFDPNFNIDTETYEGTVKFKVPVKVAKGAIAGGHKIAIDVLYQTCNDTTCLPPHTTHLLVPISIERESPAVASPVTSSPNSGVASASSAATNIPTVASPSQAAADNPAVSRATVSTAPAATQSVPARAMGSFIWLAMGMGALSLLTPCVFPMIPITVSYFTNHAKQDRRNAVVTALVYGIGIILTFTALGLLLAVMFGAGGVNQLAANPWVNLFITAIFLGFAFSLFGAYFIQVPPALMNKLDAITRSERTSGVIGALLMGFTFTLTSFTCTAPFVGTLLVMASQGNWRWPLAGMLVFSTVFAVPFFILALVPQLMSRLPKAGGWMVSVKVLMGFLEIAAAMKFLSNADLIWHWGIFTRQVVLAIWVGIGVLTVLYVLGYFRLKQESPVESVGALRVVAAIVILAVTIWMVPGLFGRQLGELESFLPPEAASSAPVKSGSSADAPNGETWILNDYDAALRKAKQDNKFVFIDFTGYTCTNCRWMEANMFTRPEIAGEMNKFVRVRLYTDGAGALFERQQKMQQEKFGTVALPLYVLLRPDGSLLKTFPGLTRNPNEFLAFLRAENSI
jgi:thiol:disulfide interchange protein DsbD